MSSGSTPLSEEKMAGLGLRLRSKAAARAKKATKAASRGNHLGPTAECGPTIAGTSLLPVPVGCVVCSLRDGRLKYSACAACLCRPYCSKRCQRLDWRQLYGHAAACKGRVAAKADLLLTTNKSFLEKAEKSKDEGNAFLRERKWEEARRAYTGSSQMALAVLHAARNGSSVDDDGATEEKAARLAAISLVNNSIALRHEADSGIAAAAAAAQDDDDVIYMYKAAMTEAREAAHVDGTYVPKALAADLKAVKGLVRAAQKLAPGDDRDTAFALAGGSLAELTDLEAKLAIGARAGQGPAVTLFCTYKLTPKSFLKMETARWDEYLRRPTTPAERAASPFNCPPPPGNSSNGHYWGSALVQASIVPMREAQWVSMSLTTKIHGMKDVYSLRLRRVDAYASADDVDPTVARGKSISRASSDTAVLAAAKHIPAFVADVLKCGVFLDFGVLGAGLFNLLPGQSHALDASTFENPNFKLIPASNHVLTDFINENGGTPPRDLWDREP